MTRRRAHLLRLSTQRIEAFSDGVFAIAITLLVLEIKIPQLHSPDQSGVPLSTALLRLWPSYFGYVFSFLMIGIYWANHHYIFNLYKQSDHVFALLDVHLVSAVPDGCPCGIRHRSTAQAKRSHLLCAWPVAARDRLVGRLAIRQLGTQADRSSAGRPVCYEPYPAISDQHCSIYGGSAVVGVERNGGPGSGAGIDFAVS